MLCGRHDCPGERLIQLEHHVAPPMPPAEASWGPCGQAIPCKGSCVCLLMRMIGAQADCLHGCGRYDCPGERLIQLEYHVAPPMPPAEASWKPRLMLLLGVVGPLTYMAGILALGIFKCARGPRCCSECMNTCDVCKTSAEASWKPHLMLLLGVVGPLTYMAGILALRMLKYVQRVCADLAASVVSLVLAPCSRMTVATDTAVRSLTLGGVKHVQMLTHLPVAAAQWSRCAQLHCQRLSSPCESSHASAEVFVCMSALHSRAVLKQGAQTAARRSV